MLLGHSYLDPAGPVPGAAQAAGADHGLDLAGGSRCCCACPTGWSRSCRARSTTAPTVCWAGSGSADDLDDRPPDRGGGGVAGAVVLRRHGGHRPPVPRHPHRLRSGSRRPGGARALASVEGEDSVDLDGRVALITGGNRGIGRAIAWSLADGGADVAVVYRKDADAAATTVKEIEALGRRARAYAADVGSVADVEAMVGAVLTDFGAIDILVNNAGVASRGRAVADTEATEVELLLRTHAVGAHSPVPGRAALDADPAPGRHRDDLQHHHPRRPAQRRALRHGQGGARDPGRHAGQGGAAPRHPRQRRRPRAGRDRHGSPPGQGDVRDRRHAGPRRQLPVRPGLRSRGRRRRRTLPGVPRGGLHDR